MGRLVSVQNNEVSVGLNLLKEFRPNLVLPPKLRLSITPIIVVSNIYISFYVLHIPFSDSFSVGIGEFDFH